MTPYELAKRKFLQEHLTISDSSNLGQTRSERDKYLMNRVMMAFDEGWGAGLVAGSKADGGSERG